MKKNETNNSTWSAEQTRDGRENEEDPGMV